MNISLEYSLNADEIKEYERADYRQGLREKKSWLHKHVVSSRWFVRLALAATGIGLLGLVYTTKPGFKSMVAITVVMVAAFILLNLCQYIYDRHLMRKKLQASQGIHLECHKDKICYKNDVMQVEFSWQHFRHFAETANLYALYYHKEAYALIIPKRVFASETDSHLFRGIAQNGIALSQGFPVETPQTDYLIASQAYPTQFDIGTDAMPLMILEYKLTYTDHKEYLKANNRKGPHRLSQRAVVMNSLKTYASYCIAVFGTVGMMWFSYKTNSDRMIGMIGAILIGSFMAVIFTCIHISKYINVKKAYGQAPKTKLEIFPDGIVHRQEAHCEKYQWHFFVHFMESDNLFALYINPTTAILIPKRAFVCDAEAVRFRSITQPGITRAQGFPVNVSPSPTEAAN